MTIQVFEEGKDQWRARKAGKGYKSVFGNSLIDVLGLMLWNRQHLFNDRCGVRLDVRFRDGRRKVWDEDGDMVFP